MKSNQSSFNATIFKKNLTRFSPAWGLYTVCALMGLVLVMDSGRHWIASNLIQSLQVLALITPCYALICAQLLFGDLYNSRMCNALHALPMKRETWFVSNVLSGFAFHLIPTAIMAALAAILLLLVGPADNIPAAGIWFVGVNLQFMCFFGIAVFCVFCVGSRFAQALVYGIVNFGALILGWLLNTLYVPQFYGIRLDFEPFFNFCPCGKMMEAAFVDDMYGAGWVEYYLGEAFAYYFIVAAVGIALLFAALRLYRRRNLECAGDFMAIKGLEPVFQVVFSLMAGAVFYFFTDQIIGINTLFFLFAGLAVGWFVGKMLLERTPRVFRLKSFLRCGVLMLVFGLTLVVASLDIFGIVRWVPEADQVESVGLSNYWYSPYSLHEDITLTDPAEIQQVIDMHQEAVDFYEQYGRSQFRIETAETVAIQQTMTKEELEKTDLMNFSLSMTIHYHMKSGRTVSRYYSIWMGDDTGDFLRQVFSRPETVFGSDMTEERFLEENSLLLLRDTWDGEEIYVHDPADLRDLYRAIIADCEAGTMAQLWDFHHPDESLYWINRSAGEAITVFSNAENTLNWLRAYGADVDTLLEKYGR